MEKITFAIYLSISYFNAINLFELFDFSKNSKVSRLKNCGNIYLFGITIIYEINHTFYYFFVSINLFLHQKIYYKCFD